MRAAIANLVARVANIESRPAKTKTKSSPSSAALRRAEATRRAAARDRDSARDEDGSAGKALRGNGDEGGAPVTVAARSSAKKIKGGRKSLTPSRGSVTKQPRLSSRASPAAAKAEAEPAEPRRRGDVRKKASGVPGYMRTTASNSAQPKSPSGREESTQRFRSGLRSPAPPRVVVRVSSSAKRRPASAAGATATPPASKTTSSAAASTPPGSSKRAAATPTPAAARRTPAPPAVPVERYYLKGRAVSVYPPSAAEDGELDLAACTSQPPYGLQLQFVHGYRGRDSRYNLFYLQSGELVYNTSALVVLYSTETRSQPVQPLSRLGLCSAHS